MSRAIALRRAALRLAVREGVDINLTALDRIEGALRGPIHIAAADARTILLLGTSTPGLANGLVSAIATQAKSLTVIEPDPGLLFSELPRLAAVNDESMTVLSADPWDLRIDPRAVDELLATVRTTDFASYRALGKEIADRAAAAPLIADESIDLVIVDLLGNRLTAFENARVLAEAFRVLRKNGRLLVACLTADEQPTSEVEIGLGSWSAVRLPLEADGAAELGSAGFHGMTYHALVDRPVRIVKGIELRAFLIDAYKGKQGICLDQGHAVIYRGPWREVLDDDDHRYPRVRRVAVCAKTHELLMRPPYREDFISVAPYVHVPLDQAPLFDCNTPALRDPAITKGRVSLVDPGRAGIAPACCGPTPSDQDGKCCGP